MKIKWNKKMQKSLNKLMKDLHKTRQLLQEKLGNKQQPAN